MLSPSAVAKIHAYHVKAGAERFLSRRYHVSGRGRAFHAVPHHQSWMFGAIWLPATPGHHLASGFDLEEPLFIARPIARAKRPQIGGKGLRITVLENAMRNEGLGFEVLSYPLTEDVN